MVFGSWISFTPAISYDTFSRSKVKTKTTQNKYCQISNRTKYTDNLVLDEEKREQIRNISTEDNN